MIAKKVILRMDPKICCRVGGEGGGGDAFLGAFEWVVVMGEALLL